MVQPGMTVSDVDNLVRNIISDNTVGGRLITRSGYSIGIAFPPSWDEGYIVSLKQGDGTVLKEGMTFHVIPWMWGVDGDKTCGISDTIHITEDGCESFFSLDQDFTVKPEESNASPKGEFIDLDIAREKTATAEVKSTAPKTKRKVTA
jgi:Xaa-Pro dipeptidase